MNTFKSRRAGFSSVEVAMSALIAGLVLAVALRAAGAAARSQIENNGAGRATHIGRGLMSEILEQPFEDPNGSPVMGPEAGETGSTRTGFDDVDDYHNWSSSPQTKSGVTLPNSSGLTTTVQVALANPDNLANNAPGPTSPDVKRITVEVRQGSLVLVKLTGVVAR